MTFSIPNLDLTGTGYCASFNFRRASRAITALYDSALQESGIRSTQFAILTAVAKLQPVSIGTISVILITDATTLTRSLDLLRQQGLLTISPRSKMRQRFLNLTLEGEKALSRALPLWREIQQKFEKQVGGSDNWNTLRAQLESLAKLAVSMEQKETKSKPLSQEERSANAVEP
ncbi:MAG: winged helix-turn-helix transcriptional regulator [Acidobacteria bacterium]|nr:winged helix-turn-helix transcriptional regulator [Acidobacteriota bacterium]MBS1866771.1 winged helix-turn-helix transcriptional regulator [Acidobacteriota bacterium]